MRATFLATSLLALASLAVAALTEKSLADFEALARDLNEGSLHSVNEKYRRGVFPDAVRRENEHEAVRVLKFVKRQLNTTTTTKPTTATTPTPRAGTGTEDAPKTTDAATTKQSTNISATLFTTTKESMFTDSNGVLRTETQTTVVVVAPTPTPKVEDDVPTTTNMGLATDAAVPRDGLGWVHVGMVVAAGVGGWVL